MFNEISRDSTSTITDTVKPNSLKPPENNNPKRVDGKTVENNEDSKTIQKKENESENKKKVELAAFTEPKAIKLDQAYILYNKGITFIDARDTSDFIAGHIKNSINIPFDDFDNYKQRLDQLSKENPLVVYCAGTECDLSILLGNLLFIEMGYKKVYVFFGGWLDWTKAKYPVEKSSK